MGQGLPLLRQNGLPSLQLVQQCECGGQCFSRQLLGAAVAAWLGGAGIISTARAASAKIETPITIRFMHYLLEKQG